MLQALEERCTDRRRFTSWPVPDSRLAQLAKAASGWGRMQFPITDVTARFRAEQLVESAMAVQASDPRFAEEQITGSVTVAWTGYRWRTRSRPRTAACRPVRTAL